MKSVNKERGRRALSARWGLALATLLTLAPACDEKTNGNGGEACEPGTTSQCACESGSSGVQRCSDEGTFDECLCDTDGGVGDGGVGDGSVDGCEPGTQMGCMCPDGDEGARVCQDDGIFSVCDCGGPDGGAGGAQGDMGPDEPDEGVDAEIMADAEVPDAGMEVECAALCGSILEACPGAWTEEPACVEACLGWGAGGEGEQFGDTVSCRETWLGMAEAPEACEALGADGSWCIEGGSALCVEYCDEMVTLCPGTFSDARQCRTLCAQLPADGLEGALEGNSVQCRLNQIRAGGPDMCDSAALDGGGVCGDLCENYCALMGDHCSQVYPDNETCLRTCERFDQEAPLGMAHGDTLLCRLYHAAASAHGGEDLCDHARPGGIDGAGRCGLCPSDDYACLPPDTFTMGSPEGEIGRSEQEQQHAVRLTRPYAVRRTEITMAEWDAVAEANPSARLCPDGVVGCDDPTLPVESVNWFQAVAFANALSMAEGLAPCYADPDDVEAPYTFALAGGEIIPSWVEGAACEGWRLPTEAEWEYAARGLGRPVRYPWGNAAPSCELTIFGDPEVDGLACGRRSLWPVCSRPEGDTPQGLCDVAGNGWEWTFDWGEAAFGGIDDPEVPVDDPVVLGPYEGHVRVLRGGSGFTNVNSVRVAHRFGVAPTENGPDISLRLVRTLIPR